MNEVDRKLLNVDKYLCDNIDTIKFLDRELVSENLLSKMRTFVEHIALKIYSENHECAVDYNSIKLALEYLKTSYDYLFLRKLHKFLQQTVSHYVPENDGAERLMLKYYEYLLKIKGFLYEKYGMEVLHNIDKFPVNANKTLEEYYTKISEKLVSHGIYDDYGKKGERFYVQKTKPFFVNDKVYYEITLSLASDVASKFDRFIAFSTFEIPSNYAVKVSLVDDEIEIVNKKMPIKIISGWMTSIRPCELQNFAKIFGKEIKIRSKDAEYMGLMNYLSKTGTSLVDFIEMSDASYDNVKETILVKAKVLKFFDVLDECRDFIRRKMSGENVVRYLLHTLNNKVIKTQYKNVKNLNLSGLRLENGCIPFDKMPYATSLLNHNILMHELLECIDINGREHELLARHINATSIGSKELYMKKIDVGMYGDIEVLRNKFNSKLYNSEKQQKRRLEIFGDKIFIKGNDEDTEKIIRTIIDKTGSGLSGYKESVEDWLREKTEEEICFEKQDIIKKMFENSKIAMIYGAAGTGKTTLIKYVSEFFNSETKLYLANTNPAIENLKRRVTARNTEFMTIAKLNKKREKVKYDILFIDECSMVSNEDMVKLLDKVEYELLILVGDVYQIEAIKFGNWFNIARYFIPDNSRYELVEPFRTKNNNLLGLWKAVRNIEDNITELLVNDVYSSNLDSSIFELSKEDEIILCLNYDGLYGINNMNRFLQNNNPNEGVKWGVWTYKKGDPILFNESDRFGNLLYNNLKGTILNIEVEEDKIWFTVEIERALNEFQVRGASLELLSTTSSGKSVVRFYVDEAYDSDHDINDMYTIVPFQVAYAVSIHKAQGLEYDSVKIVITEEIDDMITHNIFYTAITRTKNKLKIYWSGESQHKVISNFRQTDLSNDANILAARKGLKRIRVRR